MFHIGLASGLLAVAVVTAFGDSTCATPRQDRQADEDITSLLQSSSRLTSLSMVKPPSTQEPLPLFPGVVPSPELQQAAAEIAVTVNTSDPIFGYCTTEGDDKIAKHSKEKWIYNVATPELIPYIVARSDPDYKDVAVIIVPGGGQRFLSIDSEGKYVAQWLNGLGISAFVLKYRVSTVADEALQFETTTQDAQRAISLVRHNASLYGYNASRIGIIGFSNGGRVITTFLSRDHRAYASQDDADTAGFLPNFALLIYPSADYAALHKPSFLLQSPPMFLSVSEGDPCVANIAADIFAAIQAKGHSNSELHIFSDELGDHHGYGRCMEHPKHPFDNAAGPCLWTTNAALWLQRHILGEPVNRHLYSGQVLYMNGTARTD